MRSVSRAIALGVTVLATIVSVPDASASLCIRNNFNEVYVIEVVGGGGGFFSLAGEWVILGPAGGGGHPFVGTAHLLPASGAVHFTLIVGAAAGPHVLEGTLNPPAYTSGTAVERTLINTEGSSSRTLSPASACPPLVD